MICFKVLGLFKIQEYESNKLDLRAKPKLSEPMLIKLINNIIFLKCAKNTITLLHLYFHTSIMWI